MFWKRKRKLFLIVWISVSFCLADVTIAQSGRRPKTAPSVPATVPVSPTPETQPSQSNIGVNLIVIGGEITHDFIYFQSSYLGTALKECMNRLKTPLRPAMEITKGGRMSLSEAKDRAKREPDAYVLWLSFVIRDNGIGGVMLTQINYAVLMPRTAKSLTSGRVIPGDQGVVTRGGI